MADALHRLRPHRRALIAAAVLAGAAALLALLAAGHVLGFLYLAPALLLSAVLALGRFPGERALAAVVRRWGLARPRRAAGDLGPRRWSAVVLPRGGRLIGRRLAGRAPPRRIAAPA